MATNPKKSHRAIEIKKSFEETQSMVGQLCDCLMDVFDKHEIYSSPLTENTPYWNYLYDTRNGGQFHEPQTGILIKGMENDTYNSVLRDIKNIKETIVGIVEKDIELISNYRFGGTGAVGDLLIKIKR